MNQLVVLSGLLAAALGACAQQKAPELPLVARQKPTPNKVYTYVEQMPQLPGGGGMAAVIAEFQKKLRLPPLSLAEGFSGRTRIYFEVNPDGKVQHICLLEKTRSPQVDSALVAAARDLPTFVPGRQQGYPVTVSLTLLLSCLKPQ